MKMRMLVAGFCAAVVLGPLGAGIAHAEPAEWTEGVDVDVDVEDEGSDRAELATEPEPAGAGSPSDGLAYAVTITNRLWTFALVNPGVLLSSVPITGLVAGEQIVGIDRRPANDRLYGLGSTSRVYTLDPASGAATLASVMSVPLNGTAFGVDFNPVVDRLRIVSDADQNLRVNVDTGATIVDTPLAYAPGDPNAGANPNVVGSAYTNNVAGATSTVLLGYDPVRTALLRQDPPNSGLLSSLTPLGGGTPNFGFDISPENIAFLAPQLPGASQSILVAIDLQAALAGKSTGSPVIGGIGPVSGPPVRGFALAGSACTVSGAGFVMGTAGSDIICGSAGGDTILGGPGRDLIFGFDGNDRLMGDAGLDILFGQNGNDELMGGEDGDRLYGGNDNDALFGDGGNDFLFGNDASDRLIGGPGVNGLNGGPGPDQCFEANGGTVAGCP